MAVRFAAVVVLAVFAATIAARAGTTVESADISAYRGLGTWVDIYSASFRADPNDLMAQIAARGVQTLFVETGNYRQRVDLVRRQQLRALIDAAHARGVAVVAWYLPALTNSASDLRRALAAVNLVSADGDRFDAFALDIEASVVRDPAERTRRLLALSKRLRAAVGAGYPLGAIIPSPVGMKLLPHYWPGFPYAALARTYDVVLPMAYFTYRAHSAAAVRDYVQRGVAIIRDESGDSSVPIHVIGGLAEGTGTRDAAAFLAATAASGVAGFSLYDFAATKPAVWPLLRQAAAAQFRAAG